MNKGIAFTDLKLGNTLYDQKYKQGKLIDLGGVLKTKSK